MTKDERIAEAKDAILALLDPELLHDQVQGVTNNKEDFLNIMLEVTKLTDAIRVLLTT